MLEVVLYALPLGLTLSFAAGPVFFVVIETSVSQGKAKAFTLDIGAVIADMIFILLAFYGSQSLISTLKQNIYVGFISGLAVVVFGVYYVMKSQKSGQFKNIEAPTKKRYYFVKGFLLNFLNIGVFFYWLATTVAIGSLLDHDHDKMLIFYGLVLAFYLLIDIFKIYFANRFKERLKGRKIQVVEKIIGFVLIAFGLFIAVRNLF